MTYRAFILLSVGIIFPGCDAFATSMGAPVHCAIPKEAIDGCISGKAELRLVIGDDGKLSSSSVSAAKPSPLFDKWAQCLAAKIDVKMLPGTVKRLGPGTHLVPINFDPGQCTGTRANNSFKPNPHQGGA